LIFLLRNSGLIAAAGFWIIVAVCWAQNPWFDVFRHAFSDFGSSRASNPWIYNVGLIVLGVLVSLYSLYIVSASLNKIEAFGAGLMFTAGLFLALIGIFPAGTRPHNFVSTWFFVQFFLSCIPIGVGLYMRGLRAYATALLLLIPLGVAGAVVIDILVGWPSAALLEAYGVLAATAAAAIMRCVY